MKCERWPSKSWPGQIPLWKSTDGSSTSRGETRRNFAETVNVMNQKYPYLKNFKAGPWGLLTTWEYRCHFSRQWLQQLWPGSEHVSL